MHIFFSPVDFRDELKAELPDAIDSAANVDRLIFSEQNPDKVFWAQDVWRDIEIISITSIKHASQELRQRGRNWFDYQFQLHRRAALIRAQLPKPQTKVSRAEYGVWCLLAQDKLVLSQHPTSQVPLGEMHLPEEKIGPPSRAYLKLREVFARFRHQPKAGEVCLDLGSCPGGWTWELQKTGARVISVDGAAISPQVRALPRVDFLQQDAFRLKPIDFTSTKGKIDWLFSDMACSPQKLFALVEEWRSGGFCENFVCTLKFQGQFEQPQNKQIAHAFASIPNSKLLHLFHNKHELTWVCWPGMTSAYDMEITKKL